MTGNGVGPSGRRVAGTPYNAVGPPASAVERALEPREEGPYRMDSSRPNEAPSLSSDAIDFVRFCYRRRRVGWPELYDEMCAVAGRGLYRGWRFAELEEHGIGFSLHQTLELARIAEQVAVEEGDRRSRSGRSAARVAEIPVGADGAVTIVAATPTETVIDVPIVVQPIPDEPAIDVPILASAEPGALDPVASPASTPSRPALAPSMIRSAAGAS